jgi:hypothetical protein
MRSLIAAPAQAPLEYKVGCWACPESFDAARARWCSCSPAPTLVCPWCGHCFCDSPPDYRLSFWQFAPRHLWRRRAARGPGGWRV